MTTLLTTLLTILIAMNVFIIVLWKDNIQLKLRKIYAIIVNLKKQLEKTKIANDRAINDYDYYISELKKFDGEKKMEIIELLEQTYLSIIKNESRALQLDKRINIVCNMITNNVALFFLHMRSVNKVQKMKEVGYENNDG